MALRSFSPTKSFSLSDLNWLWDWEIGNSNSNHCILLSLNWWERSIRRELITFKSCYNLWFISVLVHLKLWKLRKVWKNDCVWSKNIFSNLNLLANVWKPCEVSEKDNNAILPWQLDDSWKINRNFFSNFSSRDFSTAQQREHKTASAMIEPMWREKRKQVRSENRRKKNKVKSFQVECVYIFEVTIKAPCVCCVWDL